MSKYTEFDNAGLKKYKVSERESKVNVDHFVSLNYVSPHSLIKSMPNILKGKDFKELVEATHQAFLNNRPIVIGIGGHTIKTGMSPLFIEMMRLGCISAIICNGSVVIHDFEISCFGQTSEDVSVALSDGSFGMASDTCDSINNIISDGAKACLGYGESVGKYLCENDIRYPQLSLLRNAYEQDIPVCVQVAIGTDINHQHETANGAAIGDCSMRDFRIFTQKVSELRDGGVFICFGSAVIIPEVFLKALTVCRNKTPNGDNFTTAVFDMNMQYRPFTNITSRPVLNSGKGYYFVGHHELLIPLFLFALRERVGL